MSPGITRRDFVKASILLGAGTAIASPGGFQAPPNTAWPSLTQEVEWRNKQPEMRYRRLGRTGFMISEIVCGGDPIAPDNNRHVEMAIEMGLNYLDTAPALGGRKERDGLLRRHSGREARPGFHQY
jgi:sugar phosphate isomerase/epimerase